MVRAKRRGGAKIFALPLMRLPSIATPKTIGHIALMVCDPTRTAALHTQLFDDSAVKPVEDDGGGGHGVLVQLGGTCFVLTKGAPPARCNGDHIAFVMSKAEQLVCAERLKLLRLECQFARGDSALYFTDYDNHVFELDAEGGGVTG